MTIKKVYLHWTATGYNWREPGHYHTVVTGDGTVHRLTDYHTPLYEHTYGRNTNSVGLAVACMGGSNPWSTPPTEKQIDSLCKEVAKICLGLKWPADPEKLKKLVMTHAEAAANRDYPLELVRQFSGLSPSSDYDHAAQDAGLPHANYGPATWHDGWPGGDVFRWDLWQLEQHGRGGSGGFLLRTKIVEWMRKIQSSGKPAPTVALPAPAAPRCMFAACPHTEICKSGCQHQVPAAEQKDGATAPGK